MGDRQFFCFICNRDCLFAFSYGQHLEGAAHRRMAARQRLAPELPLTPPPARRPALEITLPQANSTELPLDSSPSSSPASSPSSSPRSNSNSSYSYRPSSPTLSLEAILEPFEGSEDNLFDPQDLAPPEGCLGVMTRLRPFWPDKVPAPTEPFVWRTRDCEIMKVPIIALGAPSIPVCRGCRTPINNERRGAFCPRCFPF